MQRALSKLHDDGQLVEDADLVVSFAERQRLLGKPLSDRLSSKYGNTTR